MGRVKGTKGAPIKKTNFHGKDKANVSDLATSKSLVLLSIANSEYCATEFLEATAKQSVQEFGSTTFLIADEVYWHNLQPKDTEHLTTDELVALKNHACSLGDTYFNDNIKAFINLFDLETQEKLSALMQNSSVDEKINIINKEAINQQKHFEIVRWKTWTQQQVQDKNFDYQKEKGKLAELYSSVDSLSTSIDNAAKVFADRHKKEGGEALWLMRSKGYLTEESPAVVYLGALREYNFIIYPGDKLLPFQKTQDHFIVRKSSSDTAASSSAPINPNIQPNSSAQPYLIEVEHPQLFLNWLQPVFTRGISTEVAETKAASHTVSESPPPISVSEEASIDALTKTVLSFIKKETNLEGNAPSPSQFTFFGVKHPPASSGSSIAKSTVSIATEAASSSEPAEPPSDTFLETTRLLIPALAKLSPAERNDVVHFMEYVVNALNEKDKGRSQTPADSDTPPEEESRQSFRH
ncbi:hypothetical protein BN59_02506 [Legionella massiliensis]|uniref:Uncharacterized protein n=1 Tax=Legionella massiliensis TaxID=1034943 RepID=A0A078L2H2_9GAMM|nr:hypothetical protein [Legionella massiliensis]CDZ78198.1 hypothetical protein BN59_02506 [Legionella massiliensis]CEE13936.1 hypothetical protein BN1094_02506 [Legionella massiliensis]